MQLRDSTQINPFLVSLLSVLSACSGVALPEEIVHRTIPADDPPPSVGSPVYLHPLLGLDDVGGLYPIADIQDSPSGRRYGVEVWSQFGEDGSAVYGGGLVEYEYRSAQRENSVLPGSEWPQIWS
jgi:hypothetical protein